MNLFVTIVLMLLSNFGPLLGEEELWEKDASKDVYIEASREGFERVRLTCLGAEDALQVEVTLEEDFDGVFYTRGSYGQAKPPCYLDADGGNVVRLRFGLDECKTKASNGGSTKSNVVIVQYDDWLIFPGDNAFEVACTKTDDDTWTASIGLADPDPSAKELPKHRKSTVSSDDGTVEFTPDDIRPRKKKSKKGKKSKTGNKDEL